MPIVSSDIKYKFSVKTGLDGKVEYVTEAGDITHDGLWKIQVRVELSSGAWYTTIEEIWVEKNLV